MAGCLLIGGISPTQKKGLNGKQSLTEGVVYRQKEEEQAQQEKRDAWTNAASRSDARDQINPIERSV
jgi:hypothetical protein